MRSQKQVFSEELARHKKRLQEIVSYTLAEVQTHGARVTEGSVTAQEKFVLEARRGSFRLLTISDRPKSGNFRVKIIWGDALVFEALLPQRKFSLKTCQVKVWDRDRALTWVDIFEQMIWADRPKNKKSGEMNWLRQEANRLAFDIFSI